MKTNTTTRFSAEVEERGEHDRERDHQARELRLAHDRLLADDRADRRAVASWKKPNSTMLNSSSTG